MRRTALLLLLVPILVGCISADPSKPRDATPTSQPSASTPLGGSCSPTQPASNVDVAPTRAESVRNQPGSFSYSGSPAAKTATNEYAWQDQSGSAHLTWSGSVASGTMHVKILDACSRQEFDQTNGMSASSSSTTLAPGRAGPWLIHMDFTAFTGSVSFTVNG